MGLADHGFARWNLPLPSPGLYICHLGDFGQPALCPEQRQAIGEVDILFVPVGGGPTIGGVAAADLVRSLEARRADALPHAWGRLPLASG